MFEQATFNSKKTFTCIRNDVYVDMSEIVFFNFEESESSIKFITLSGKEFSVKDINRKRYKIFVKDYNNS